MNYEIGANKIRALVILPTYNEKENIEKLIKEILAQNLSLDILVVDDNSPDGTGQLVEGLRKNIPQLFILHREKKEGLGWAYISGFKWALEKGYDYIFQMDADLSHQPKYLPLLWEKLKENDFVIGSRYIKGGGIVGWPWYRLFLSCFASLYASTILGTRIKDFTGGFNGFRKEVLKKIAFDKIISQGYAFLLEFKYKVVRNGFKVAEVPIIFIERRNGKSKISKRIIWEAIINCWKLRFGL